MRCVCSKVRQARGNVPEATKILHGYTGQRVQQAVPQPAIAASEVESRFKVINHIIEQLIKPAVDSGGSLGIVPPSSPLSPGSNVMASIFTKQYHFQRNAHASHYSIPEASIEAIKGIPYAFASAILDQPTTSSTVEPHIPIHIPTSAVCFRAVRLLLVCPHPANQAAQIPTAGENGVTNRRRSVEQLAVNA
jgi:hypothetical protein